MTTPAAERTITRRGPGSRPVEQSADLSVDPRCVLHCGHVSDTGKLDQLVEVPVVLECLGEPTSVSGWGQPVGAAHSTVVGTRR